MKFSYRPTITLTLKGNAVTSVNIVQYNARVRKAMGESASLHLQIGSLESRGPLVAISH